MTKKVGSAGKLGPKYGKGIRDEVIGIEKRSKKIYECPNCHKKALKRESSGVWICRKCGKKYAGKAFSPASNTRSR